MAVPPDRMMDLLRQGRQDQASPSPADSGMAPPSSPPMASPMSTPEPKLGNREGALVNLSIAIDLIEQALPAIGSETEEGQKALAAIRALSGVIGPGKRKVRELQSSEILHMLQNLPQAGGATPEGLAMMQTPAVSGLPPTPGAMPGGGQPPAGPGPGLPPLPGAAQGGGVPQPM